MSMALNNRRLINQVNPKHAKYICKQCHSYPKSVGDLAKALEVTEITMMHWLIRLEEIGALDTIVDDDVILWHCTPYGYTSLANARFGAPLTGAQFTETVFKVTGRACAYNEENRFPYLIDEICLFGPILNQPWRFDNPDFAISIHPKPEINANEFWQSRYCKKYGPQRYLSIIDELAFPQNELSRFLKQNSKHIQIYLQDVSELSNEWRIVFQRDATERHNIGTTHQVMSSYELKEFGQAIDDQRNRRASQDRKERKRITQTNESIVSFWKETPQFQMLNLPSVEDASKSCWRCGSHQDIQRCHIIPDSLGGANAKSNLVLLCSRCHAEAPNIADERILFDWIKAYRDKSIDDFWLDAAMKEYEFIYGKSIQSEITAILKNIGMQDLGRDQEAFEQLILLSHEASIKAVYHFGQPYFNTATRAGLFRVALKDLPDHLRSIL